MVSSKVALCEEVEVQRNTVRAQGTLEDHSALHSTKVM